MTPSAPDPAHDPADTPAMPAVVVRLADGAAPRLLWRNELGGLTFRCGPRVVKWNPRSTGVDLARERDRLAWLATRHPAPAVHTFGEDDEGQWLVTSLIDAAPAIGPAWTVRPETAVIGIAAGLRALHAIPVDEVPPGFRGTSWFDRHPPPASRPRSTSPPPAVDPVVVHGDACAPNTLLGPDGAFRAHVDVGDLGVGDPWADLAVASMSIAWNYDPDRTAELEARLFAAYGVERDEPRIRWYRALWEAWS